MPEAVPVYVLDTSVIIDLHLGGVLEAAFRLPARLVAPDVIVAELRSPTGDALLALGLEQRTFSPDEVEAVAVLVARHRRSSANDIFALVLARSSKGVLLTGDKHLRRAAQGEMVPVHGTLWILDELVRLGILPPGEAAQALRKMLDGGSRLPQDECRRRFAQWEGGDV